MTIRILFFGLTAELAGERETVLPMREAQTSAEVFATIVEARPRLQNRRLLFSVNQEFASGNEIVRDGDELAVFTAVSGG